MTRLVLIWRILRGPGNTVRGAPTLLPELRAIVDSCATGDQGASLGKQVRYRPAKLPSGCSPGFAMWGKSRLRVSIPGWAGGESLYMGAVRAVRVPGGLEQCPDRRDRCWRGWWQ